MEHSKSSAVLFNRFGDFFDLALQFLNFLPYPDLFLLIPFELFDLQMQIDDFLQVLLECDF